MNSTGTAPPGPATLVEFSQPYGAQMTGSPHDPSGQRQLAQFRDTEIPRQVARLPSAPAMPTLPANIDSSGS
jgi:hypothetical protein